MNKKVIGAIKLAVSSALIVYLFSIVDFGETFSRFKTIDSRFILAALALLIVQVAVSALKWKLILRSDGLDTPYLRLLNAYYIGNFLSLFLPSSFGGDIYRVYALSADNRSLGKTTSSVLFDRLTGLFALLTIALIGYVSMPDTKFDMVFVALYLLGLVSFWLCTSQRAVTALQASSIGIIRKLAVLLESFRTYRRDLSTLWKVIAISMFFQFMIVVINKIYALALSIDISLGELLVIIPLVYLTEVLPISINGIGVRDSAFVFFYVMLGYTKEEGLAVALLVLAMRYVSGLVGGVVLLGSVIRQHFVARTTTS